MNQSGYSSSDMLSMQADAIRRVREMQRRAQRQVSAPPPEPLPPPPPQERGHAQPAPASPRQEHPEERREEKSGSFLGGLLDSLNLDNDRLLLLGLIFLLAHEGADTMLILALGYIMM